MSNVDDFMRQNFPSIGPMVKFVIASTQTDTKGLVKDILQRFKLKSVVNLTKELTYSNLSYDVQDKDGNLVTIQSNLLSEFIVEMYSIKGQPMNQTFLDVILNLEQVAISLTSDTADIQNLKNSLQEVYKNAQAINQELIRFVDEKSHTYKGHTFKSLLEDHLIFDSPAMYDIIKTMELKRPNIYKDIVGTQSIMTDPTSYLRAFAKAHRSILILNIKSALDGFDENVLAVKGFKQYHMINPEDGDISVKSLTDSILWDNVKYKKEPSLPMRIH
jgi:hypothetical protein